VVTVRGVAADTVGSRGPDVAAHIEAETVEEVRVRPSEGSCFAEAAAIIANGLGRDAGGWPDWRVAPVSLTYNVRSSVENAEPFGPNTLFLTEPRNPLKNLVGVAGFEPATR
jgi:hypothetical protein